MENVIELICPNCDVTLHASLELRASQNIKAAPTVIIEEVKPYINLLSEIFGRKLNVKEIEEFFSPEGFNLLKNNFEEILKTLKPREEKVIKMRFGIGRSALKQTLNETGKHFSLTGERIRQIEDKAIEKLKHPSRESKLRKLLEDVLEISKTSDVEN